MLQTTTLAQTAIDFAHLANSGAHQPGRWPVGGVGLPTESVHKTAHDYIKAAPKEGVGALAQLFVIMESTLPLPEKRGLVKKLIESPLFHDAAAMQRVVEWGMTSHPDLAKYKAAPLTYRYLLKNVPYGTLVAMAATMSNPGVAADAVLLSRIQHGTWTKFCSDYGFDAAEYLKLKPELLSSIEHHSHGETLEGACAWFPDGPVASGVLGGDDQTMAAVNPTVQTILQGQHQAIPAHLTPAGILSGLTGKTVSIQTTGANPTFVVQDDIVDVSPASIQSAINQGNTMTTATSPAAAAISAINPAVKPLIDGMLVQAGVGLTIDAIAKEIIENASLKKALADAETMANDVISDLRKKLSSQASVLPATINVAATSSTGTPSGTITQVQASTIFPALKGVNLMVPMFKWDAPHPDVPVVNDDYIFRTGMLINALRCLVAGENAWLSGHTGSGKTTFIEQIASRLGWPVARIAFDSNVDRSELVGRMSLKADGKGGTISEWLPGILERATTGGYIILCDEMDAGHPNALYTLQPLLEGKCLTLLEDGGRLVGRSPMTRIFATGNTTGNGDPSGLYPACRILSAATLDRFQTFINVPYMTLKEEITLISSAVPGLDKNLLTKLGKFGTEMRKAFTQGETPISYSPRRSVAFAREIESLLSMGFTDMSTVVSTAFKSKLFDAASDEFRQRLTEIANNALGGIDPTKSLA
jgi:MoxR-like ATPase